jgi:protein-tyrosine-phosphatase
MKIVFICNANIVHSFMAERAFKRLVKSHGNREVEVSSDGLLDAANWGSISRGPAQITGIEILSAGYGLR